MHGMHLCMYVNTYTHYTHTYVHMDKCMYINMSVFGCIYAIKVYTLGMYICRHT